MRDRIVTMIVVTIVALTGMSQTTFESHGLQGSAESRAKANNCLDAVATIVKTAAISINITKPVMAVVALADCVAL